MRCLVLASVFLLAANAMAAKSHAVAVRVGDTCVLKKKLKATIGKKAITVPGGHSVNVTAVEKANVVITTNGKSARAKKKDLEEICMQTSAPPPPLLSETPSDSLAAANAPPTVAKDEPPLAAPSALTPTASAAPTATPEPVRNSEVPASVNRESAPSNGVRIAGWTLAIGGGAAILAGGACVIDAELQAASLNNRAKVYNAAPVRTSTEFNSITQGRAQANTLAIVGYVVGGVGVAALGTGIVLLLVSKPSTRVGLVPNPFGASLLATF